MNIQQEVGHVKKGWVRKSTKDAYTVVDLIDIHVFLVRSQLTFLILPFFFDMAQWRIQDFLKGGFYYSVARKARAKKIRSHAHF